MNTESFIKGFASGLEKAAGRDLGIKWQKRWGKSGKPSGGGSQLHEFLGRIVGEKGKLHKDIKSVTRGKTGLTVGFRSPDKSSGEVTVTRAK
jgi:hypothetical protein